MASAAACIILGFYCHLLSKFTFSENHVTCYVPGRHQSVKQFGSGFMSPGPEVIELFHAQLS